MEKILLELLPEENSADCVSDDNVNPLFLNDIKTESNWNENLTYNEFYINFMKKNIPIVFENVSNEWKCKLDWFNQETGKINFDFLRNYIGNNCLLNNRITNSGNFNVPILNCSKKYFNSHEKLTNMNFNEFLNYWESKINIDEINMNRNLQNNIENNDYNMDILYLKDWHLKSLMPDYEFYVVPKYFASDWLNEYLIDNGKDDYRFCYFGPKGSWTPFHSDVFGSYSWSANIYGQKKWLLLPPGEELKLGDYLGNLPFSIDEELLTKMNCKYFKIIQKTNDAIFVPSNWYHQVENITDTISINHNWFNSCNAEIIRKNLSDNMKKVQKEIQDCSDMEDFREHCQLMLQCSFGMNYYDFLDILEYIKKKSILAIFNKNDVDDNNINQLKYNLYKLNSKHYYEDLKIIFRICQKMKTDIIVRNDIELLNRILHLENETNLFDGLF